MTTSSAPGTCAASERDAETGTTRSDAPVTTAVGTARRHSERSRPGVSARSARCSTRKLRLDLPTIGRPSVPIAA